MISINRPPGVPDVLQSPDLDVEREQAREFFKSRRGTALQSDFQFRLPASDLKVLRDKLTAVFGHRCAFCNQVSKLDVHRFRPSQRAINADRTTSRPHYYWLAWE